MSKKNEDNVNDEDLASFETLETDTGEEDKENKAEQLKAALALLKEKLSPDDYKAVTATFGIKTELTNEDLLETILAHLKEMAKKPDEDKEEDEYEYPKPKTKKGADPTFQEYVKSCMKGGKDMTACSAEYKEKYKAPEKKEEEAVEKLAPTWLEEFKKAAKKPGEDEEEEKDPDKLQEIIKDLKERVGAVEERARLAEIGNEVDQLVHDKHAAPIQKESILKLGAAMTPEMKDDFFQLFRTQKYNVAEDAGKLQSGRPGEALEIDDETRERILKTHGLSQLIEDKGVRRAN